VVHTKNEEEYDINGDQGGREEDETEAVDYQSHQHPFLLHPRIVPRPYTLLFLKSSCLL